MSSSPLSSPKKAKSRKKRNAPHSSRILIPIKFEQGRSAHENMTDEEVAIYELNNMRLAESEQVVEIVDKFWGLDEEAARCRHECDLMEHESILSTRFELRMRHKERVAEWERDEVKLKYDEAYTNALTEAQARKAYIKGLHRANTTKEVMNYRWPTKEYISPMLHPEIDLVEGKSSLAWDSMVSYGRIDPEDQRRAMPQDPSLDEAIFGIVQVDLSSVSVINNDGMQKSRIIQGQFEEESDLAASVLKGRNIGATIADRGIYPTVKASDTSHGGGLEASLGLDMTKPRSLHKKRLVEKQLLKKRREDLAYKGPLKDKINIQDSSIHAISVVGENIAHNDDLDGHPVYKWDQEMILRASFSLMVTSKSNNASLSTIIRPSGGPSGASGNTTARTAVPGYGGNVDDGINGVLHFQKFMKAVTEQQVMDLLKFTVFGAWIKLRQWQAFEALFGLDIDADDELPEDEYTLDLDGWLTAAQAAAKEDGILPHHIRTSEEHKAVVTSQGPWMQYLSEGNQGWFAELARQQTNRAIREARLKRSIGTGDLVWALYGAACRWLPATIERVNGDGSYNVSYPLSMRGMQEARLMASSRELLQLPSHEPDTLNPRGGETSDERVVLNKVFDMIDLEVNIAFSGNSNQNSPGSDNNEGTRGKVKFNFLMNLLTSPRYSRIIRTSAALNFLFSDLDGGNGSESEGSGGHLNQFHQVLQDACSDDQDYVSKVNFVEFCLVAADIAFFNGIV